MPSRQRSLCLSSLATLLMAATACQSQSGPAIGGTGGTGGAPASPVDAGVDAAADLPLAAALCPEKPTPRRADVTVLEIPLALQLAGKVMRFGDTNVAADGEAVTPLNVRFYLSNVTLTRTDGAAPVPVDIVGTDGAPAPYGVHFFNAEDPSSETLRIRAPAGSYSGISFSFGLPDGCNAGPPDRREPLSEASQMTWPHGFGYLFLRYESRVESNGDGGAGQTDGATHAGDAGDGSRDTGVAAAAIPTAIHMGGWPMLLMAPDIHVNAAVVVPAAAGDSRSLRLVMDEVFKGARTAVPSALPIPPPGEEGALGENLRQAAPHLMLFVLAP